MPISTANVTTNISNVYVSVGNTAVTFLSLCNYSVSNVSANVYVVPSGGSPSVQNIVFSTLDITTNDTYQIYAGSEKILLGNGDTIRCSASGNSAITAVTSYTSI